MATEEAELSFIRCPGCRSLVPAIARRCKMCGFVLDTGEKDRIPIPENSDNNDSSSKKSRVRQRTVTVSASDIHSIKSSLANAQTENISEVVENEELVEEQVIEELDPQLDEESQNLDPQELEVHSSDETDESSEEDSDDDTTDSKPRLRVKRRKKRKRKPRAEVSAGSSSSGVLRVLRTNSNKLSKSDEDSYPLKDDDSETEIEQSLESNLEENEENIDHQFELHNNMENMKTDKRTSHDDGMLVGWFVSSGTKGREARELRAGKYFLSGEKLRPTDFVISHPSLSTPHCLLDVRSGKPLRVQDLMSESGTSIRRAGADTFEKCTETVEVFHGDTVRFGEEEVLLCLIP
jgi:hypothetical protein